MIESIIVIASTAVLCFLLYILSKEIQKQQKSAKSNKLKFERKENIVAKPINSLNLSPLKKRLLSMLAGDQNAALRLINAVREKHPGKDELWYWEKVISDLERDRRY